jgi:uncharacterized protein DUF2750
VASVANSRSLWALRNAEGWANWSDEDGSIFPVWDAMATAKACAEKTFPGYQPAEVDLESFLETILPALSEQEIFVGVNLNPDMTGVSRSCAEFEDVLGTSDA